MSTLPYTTADLRTEAARQHATAIEDPDFMGIGEQMEDAVIQSRTVGVVTPVGTSWSEALDGDDFEAAQRAVDELLRSAADTSDWAITLGADKLQPDPRHVDLDGGAARLHIAFRADLTDEQRAMLLGVVATVLGEQVSGA